MHNPIIKMVLDVSPVAVTVSSMDIISPTKSNLMHLSQNIEPTATITIANKMSSKQMDFCNKKSGLFMVTQVPGSFINFRTYRPILGKTKKLISSL
jgi:hypothetical protein